MYRSPDTVVFLSPEKALTTTKRPKSKYYVSIEFSDAAVDKQLVLKIFPTARVSHWPAV
jgi:hypothetical protein